MFILIIQFKEAVIVIIDLYISFNSQLINYIIIVSVINNKENQAVKINYNFFIYFETY